LLQLRACFEEVPARSVDPRPFAHRHHGREHGQAGGVGGRHLDSTGCQGDRRLNEACPRQPSAPPVERAEAGWYARNRAGGDSDRIMNELGPERHRQLQELRPARVAVEAWNDDEEVQKLRATFGCIPPERVPAARETRHDRFGDAGRQAGCNSRVGCRATLHQDLQARLSRSRVPRGNSRREAVACSGSLFARQRAESVTGRAPHLC
jgi:hypothetical protein